MVLYLQIDEGHIVTGMRDNVVWGFYIVNFIFFMGLSYSGALISGVLHLFHTGWRKPIIRMAELITIISLIIGPFFIFFCIGRLDRLHFLFIYPRIQSPITWDVIAIMTDLVGCFLYLYLSFIEDFAILRDYQDLNVAPWKKKLYKVLSLGFTGTEKEHKILVKRKNCYGCNDYCNCNYCLLCSCLDLWSNTSARLAFNNFRSVFCYCSSILRNRIADYTDVDFQEGISS